jgi:Tfp pilus assembly protein PilX
MALVVALIMLSLMTLMAIASFNVGRTSMDIIGNMQQRSEVVAAANGAIQEAISTKRLVEAPASVFLQGSVNACAGANTRCFDTNGDTVNDITVTLTPQPACLQAQAIPNASLNFLTVGSSECSVEVDPSQYGIQGGITGNSLCANSLWQVSAVATDAVTASSVTVVEGVAVLVATNNVTNFCP